MTLRNVAKPAFVVRNVRMMTPRCYSSISYGISACQPMVMQRRMFSSEMLTAKEMKAKIDACGINDAGKEKVINEEIKKKNFSAVRDLAEEYSLSSCFTCSLMMDEKTKELGILCFVQAADAGDMLSQFAVGNLYMQRYWQEKMKPDL